MIILYKENELWWSVLLITTVKFWFSCDHKSHIQKRFCRCTIKTHVIHFWELHTTITLRYIVSKTKYQLSRRMVHEKLLYFIFNLSALSQKRLYVVSYNTLLSVTYGSKFICFYSPLKPPTYKLELICSSKSFTWYLN